MSRSISTSILGQSCISQYIHEGHILREQLQHGDVVRD
jgi:hypothetical protein